MTLLFSIIGFSSSRVFELFTFSPTLVIKKGEFWRIFTHALIHQNVFHLLLNAFILLLFGREVEAFFQSHSPHSFWYLLLYVSAIPAAVTYRGIKNKNEADYRAVGSSGAVSAIIFAYIAIRPQQAFAIELFYPISIPGIWLGIAFLVYSLAMSRKKQDTIGHDAHLFGAVWGYLFTLCVFPELWDHLMKAFH